jgi:cation transport ATPase
LSAEINARSRFRFLGVLLLATFIVVPCIVTVIVYFPTDRSDAPAARRGLLLKGAAVLEGLGKLTAIALEHLRAGHPV